MVMYVSRSWPEWATGIDDWVGLQAFMDDRRAKAPYPTYLYRYVVPRNDALGRTSGDFGSDLYEASPSPVPLGRAHTDGSLADFYRELRGQLGKYRDRLVPPPVGSQVQAKKKGRGKKRGKAVVNGGGGGGGNNNRKSPLVSLSGNLRWTVQKACKIQRSSQYTKVPGIAVFKAGMDNRDGGGQRFTSYRVADLLDFFYLKKWPPAANGGPAGPTSFPRDLRRWAIYADEYVVWSHVPRAALVSYVSSETLAPRGQLSFLTMNFRRSADLAAFQKKTYKVKLSTKLYWNFATRFVGHFILGQRQETIVHKPGLLQPEVLIAELTCSRRWGFLTFPFSGAVPKNFSPDLGWFFDFVDSAQAGMPRGWELVMGRVAAKLTEAVIEATGEMKWRKSGHIENCRHCIRDTNEEVRMGAYACMRNRMPGDGIGGGAASR